MAKGFSWSFSRLGSFEGCAKKYYEISVAKNFQDQENEASKWGTATHDAFKNYLQHGIAFPVDMIAYKRWGDRVKNGPGQLYVEQKFALDKQFQPTTWMAQNVWVRVIGDAVRIWDKIGLVLDWKTGKDIKEDETQLMLAAQCVFSYWPEVEKVRSEYVWLAHGDAHTTRTYTRTDLAGQWSGLLDRVQRMEQATQKNEWMPNPSGLCVRHCPVRTCPFWGKGNKR
jgi:hypothetical protein